MIIRKLEAMIRAADPYPIEIRKTAITAFFPYAVLQEQNGRHEALDAFLRVQNAARPYYFMEPWVEPFVATLLNEEGPISAKRAATLTSPHLPWRYFANGEHLVPLWAAAVLAVPYTDKTGQIIADTLLKIAACSPLLPHIPSGMWLWLNKRPSLPPDCTERRWGSAQGVVQTIRALGDVEALTSYLLLVWSEWDYIYGLEEMSASIREDLGGIWMGHHREDLLRRLDYILGQLDRGLEYLRQSKPSLNEEDIQRMKAEYGQLKEVLLEVAREATGTLVREYHIPATLFGLLTPADRCGIPLEIHVCDPPPISLIACLTQPLPLPSILREFTAQFIRDPQLPTAVLGLLHRCCFNG